MFGLVFDILDQSIFVADRTRKRAISVLPMFERRKHIARLDPIRRACLDFLHEICQCDHWMQDGQNVKVVFDATDSVKM